MPADDRRRSRSPRRTDKERRPRSPSPNRRSEKDRPRRSRSPDRQRAHSRSRSPRRRSRSPRRHAPRDPKSRSKSRSRSPRARRHRSRSASSDSGSSDADHDSRKRKQDKDERRREKKARRKEKKEKKERKRNKAGKSGAVTGQWGQYGIINESDLYNKDAEFRTWLVEECKLNPETMSKDATKKHFAKFVEDFNTATLPHEKFYNIDVYERRMNLIRNGETLPINDSYDMNADMAAHTSRHKRSVVEHDSYLSKEQLAELRRVQNERIEAGKMKALGLEVKGTMGVRMDGSAFD